MYYKVPVCKPLKGRRKKALRMDRFSENAFCTQEFTFSIYYLLNTFITLL